MTTIKNIKYIFLLLGLTLTIFSCGKSDTGGPDPDEGRTGSFSIEKKDLVPDEQDLVRVIIQFEQLENIDYLQVQKNGADFFVEEIAQNKLSKEFTYEYKVQEDDPESFGLVFSIMYRDGGRSKNETVRITNKKGFFIQKLERIARVTGASLPSESFPDPNRTAVKWNVGGTDLGIIWEMDPGKYGIFFGDTFGRDFKPNPEHPGPNGGSWRSNVLGFTENKDLDNGILLKGMREDASGDATELIDGHQAGLPTSIPTAAIRANGMDYVHYFNTDPILEGVRFYYSGLYKSTDNGENWTKVESVLFPDDSRFALAGYFKKEGYVYMIGTPAYRDKPAYLARIREEDMENQDQYEYWNGTDKAWIRGDEGAATVLIPGTVGELSFIYHKKLEKWLIIYGDVGHGFVSLRTAEEITGPWSEVMQLVSPEDYPMHYGPYFHPLSAEGNELFFTLSMWEPYNVFLMKATIVDR